MKTGQFIVLLIISIITPLVVYAGIDEVKVVDPLTPIYTAEDVKKAPAQDTLIMTGPRNGVCSAQAAVLGSGLDSVRASISSLKKGSSEIPATAIKVRYAAKEEGFKIGPLDQRKGHTTHNYLDPYYDILLDSPPKDTGVMPVWVTVSIPSSASAGEYTGTLKIGPETVPVKLTVTPWICPDPGNFETHVGIATSTETLALYYKKKFWSEEHWKLIEKELQLLGPTGCDDLWIPALNDLGYRKGGTALLRFTKQVDTVVPDFTVLDRYLGLYKKYCGRPEHIIVMLWTGLPRGRKGRPGKPEVNVIVDGQKTAVPRVYAPGGKEIWKPALDGIKDRIEKMGWDPNAICLGLGYDQLPSNDEIKGFIDIGYKQWAAWSHQRGMKKAGMEDKGENIELGNGMVITYNAHPYTPEIKGWVRPKNGKVYMGQIKDGIQGGWGNVSNTYTSTRNDIHKYHALTQWRAYANGTTVGGYDYPLRAKGFAFLWFDWFKLPGSGMQPFIFRECDVMSRNNSPALVAPGPEGPVGTVRYEMLREGIQENEARISIEKALIGNKISGQIADEARAVLAEMIKYRYQDGKFHGGHAGGNLGKPDRMWLFPAYPAWQDLSARLFTEAANIAKVINK